MNPLRQIQEASPRERLGLFLLAVPCCVLLGIVAAMLWTVVVTMPWVTLGGTVLGLMAFTGAYLLDTVEDQDG